MIAILIMFDDILTIIKTNRYVIKIDNISKIT
jgi:hypothetical protein